MSNTDRYFETLAIRLQHDAAGLLALSEIMESHMRYSIDPRLSQDPLTALAAVMRQHDLKFEFGRESDSYCWSYVSSPKIDGVALCSTAKYRGVILFSDIKSEADNENEKPSETKCFCGRNFIKGATKKMCDHVDCIPH